MARTSLDLARMALALLDRADLGASMSAVRLQHAIDTMERELAPAAVPARARARFARHGPSSIGRLCDGTDPDGFEQSARIAEAFAAGQTDEVVALLEEIARAIRDREIDD